MGDARCTFDDDFKADWFGTSARGFDRTGQRVNGIDVCRAADFWDHDLVDTIAGLFQQIHDITIPIGRVQPVDSDRQGLGAPVNVADRLNDVLTGLFLVVGRDAVFQIQVDHIRGGCCHFLKDGRARAGAKQLAPVRAGNWGGLNSEGHDWQP